MFKVEKLNEKEIIAALEKVNGALEELKKALGYTHETDLLEKELSLELYDSPLRVSEILSFAENVKGCQAKLDKKYTELRFSSFADIDDSFPLYTTGQSMYYKLLDFGIMEIIPDIAFFWEHLRSYGTLGAEEHLVYNVVELAKKQIANEGNFELLTQLSTSVRLVEVEKGEVVNHISDDIVSDYVYSVHSIEDPCGEYDDTEPLYTDADLVLVCACIAVCKNMRP